MTLKPSQKSLVKWTDQKWQYSSDKEKDKPKAKRGRYLPKAAWDSLSPSEKGSTNTAKRKGTASGSQFVKQPDKIAKKVAKYRK